MKSVDLFCWIFSKCWRSVKILSMEELPVEWFQYFTQYARQHPQRDDEQRRIENIVLLKKWAFYLLVIQIPFPTSMQEVSDSGNLHSFLWDLKQIIKSKNMLWTKKILLNSSASQSLYFHAPSQHGNVFESICNSEYLRISEYRRKYQNLKKCTFLQILM